MSFLNDAGLERVWKKMKAYVDGKLSAAPVTLYSGTKYNTAANTWEYVSVSDLNKYQEVGFWVRVGDQLQEFVRVNRADVKDLWFSGYANASYNATLQVKVDFANNRIGVSTYRITGWGYSTVNISGVVGLA